MNGMNEKQRRQIEYIDEIYNKVVLRKESTAKKHGYDEDNSPFGHLMHGDENLPPKYHIQNVGSHRRSGTCVAYSPSASALIISASSENKKGTMSLV